MDPEVEIFLEHYGIKGQKWGQRKVTYQKAKQLHRARLERVKNGTASKEDRSNIILRRYAQGSLALIGGLAVGALTLKAMDTSMTKFGERFVRSLIEIKV